MKIRLFNNTDNIITINDVGTISFVPDEYTEIDTNTTWINQSNQIINHISLGNIIVNNYSEDMLPVDGIKWMLSGADILPRGKDGKVSVHATSKYPGLYVYWTGRGDNFENTYIGNGQSILLQHKVGDPKSQQKYIDFYCIDNKTEMHEGTVLWENARPGDSGSCSAVTSVMPTEPGTNTNFNLYNGYLIVPAAGDGNIQVTGDLTSIDPAAGCFVEMIPDETGKVTPGFWNADYNPTTRRFENIAPAPDGSGRFNLFAVEVYISRFVNHLNFLGSGSVNLRSEDSAGMAHGMRLLHHMNTSTIDGIDDHEWTFSVVLTLQRDKTY
jgi:hypothetical protein